MASACLVECASLAAYSPSNTAPQSSGCSRKKISCQDSLRMRKSPLSSRCLLPGQPMLRYASAEMVHRGDDLVSAAYSGDMTASGSTDGINVPRICTLKEFSEQQSGGDNGSVSGLSETEGDLSVVDLVKASVKATAEVKDFETFSGRLAMMGFAAALSVELITGHGIFSGIDMEGLVKIVGLCLLAAGSAGGFAYAWRSKKAVSLLLASGCATLVDSAVDGLIQGLMFDEEDKEAWEER